jgi:hypothetical protein
LGSGDKSPPTTMEPVSWEEPPRVRERARQDCSVKHQPPPSIKRIQRLLF